MVHSHGVLIYTLYYWVLQVRRRSAVFTRGVDHTAGKHICVAFPDVCSYRKLVLVYTLMVGTLYGFQSSTDLSVYAQWLRAFVIVCKIILQNTPYLPIIIRREGIMIYITGSETSTISQIDCRQTVASYLDTFSTEITSKTVVILILCAI